MSHPFTKMSTHVFKEGAIAFHAYCWIYRQLYLLNFMFDCTWFYYLRIWQGVSWLILWTTRMLKSAHSVEINQKATLGIFIAFTSNSVFRNIFIFVEKVASRCRHSLYKVTVIHVRCNACLCKILVHCSTIEMNILKTFICLYLCAQSIIMVWLQ
jgi:hypothetical protein